MKFEKVAPRYSKALFQMDGSKEQRLEILEKLLDLWNKDPKLQTFLTSPTISKGEKLALLKQALGDGKDENLGAFFNLLIESNRCKVIPAIIQNYKKKVTDSLGILEVTLCTAVPIDRQEKEVLKLKLEHQYNKKVEIKEKINPQIIGGVILSMGDKLLDFSIRGRLETLRKQLCQ